MGISAWTRAATGLLMLSVAFAADGTRSLPPTISEVVDGSDHIGLVEIMSARVYRAEDADGEIQCGILYQGNWLNSLSGDSGEVEFTSSQNLQVDTVYLVFLGSAPLPRRLMSTNSRSEAMRSERLTRKDRLCARSKDMARTVFRSSRFLNEQYVANNLRKGIWVQDPGLFDSPAEEIAIFPTELSIAGKRIPREQFLEEYFDERKHQVVRTAGADLIMFRAIAWEGYCARLAE